jgi:hypothetical protein
MKIMAGRLVLTGNGAERFVVNLPAVARACSRWSLVVEWMMDVITSSRMS